MNKLARPNKNVKRKRSSPSRKDLIDSVDYSDDSDDMALVQPGPDVDEAFIYQLLSTVRGNKRLLDPSESPWHMAEVEAAWSRFKAAQSAHNSLNYGYPQGAPANVKRYHDRRKAIGGSVMDVSSISAEVMALDIPPLAREELQTRITTLGRGRKNPKAAIELKNALRKSGDKIRVSSETAVFIYDELIDAKRILSGPGMASDPMFSYHLLGVKQALKNMSQVRSSAARGPASTVLALVNAAQSSFLDGAAIDFAGIQSLMEAAAHVLRMRSGSASGGCAVKVDASWRVMSEKGRLRPARYRSKKLAQRAVDAA